MFVKAKYGGRPARYPLYGGKARRRAMASRAQTAWPPRCLACWLHHARAHGQPLCGHHAIPDQLKSVAPALLLPLMLAASMQEGRRTQPCGLGGQPAHTVGLLLHGHTACHAWLCIGRHHAGVPRGWEGESNWGSAAATGHVRLGRAHRLLGRNRLKPSLAVVPIMPGIWWCQCSSLTSVWPACTNSS